MKRENEKKEYDLIVIGGGPSGMMMAGRAGELGAKVLLLEKNKNLGEKLKITGGGRCNITNAEFDIRKFLNNFSESKNFLFSPFSKFSVKDTFDFFEKQGLPLIIEENKRVFPQTQKASDVFKILEKYIRSSDGKIKTNTQVVKINQEKNKIISIETKSGEKYFAKNFAIATGGTSAKWTGSTGDGFKWLEKLGHTINKPKPGLVPLTTNDLWVHRLAGTSLDNVKINFIQNKKIIFKKNGRILFTHFGVSGPTIINSSFETRKLLSKGRVFISIDIFPNTNEGDLNRQILEIFEKNKNKKIKNILTEILPKNLIDEILNFFENNLIEKKANSVTKKERGLLAKTIKNLSFEITGTLGLEKAIITDGGIILDEVNFKNMTSKIYPNLYLLGDILNINRPSGGFSLQLCWTTGYVAGSDISKTKNTNNKQK